MKLNELRDNLGARKARSRVGRGIGSGMGKTSTSGVKGQKARSGVAINGFEGGQMPLYRRLPKFGFKRPNAPVFAEVTTGRLQRAVDAGKLATDGTVDAAALKAAGVVKHTRDGVRLLNSGELTAKLTLSVAGVTAGAKAAVEAAGGSVTVVAKAAADSDK